MPKVKPSQEEVVKYLTENASEFITLTSATKTYAKSLGLSITTIINILNKSDKAEEVRALYKVTGKSASAIEETVATVNDAISIKELTVADVNELLNSPAVDVNPLADVKLKRVIFEINEGQEIDIDSGQIYIDGINGWLNREQVATLAKDAKKILEVYDYIYKK